MGNHVGEYTRYSVVLIILVAAAFGSIHILRATLGTRYPLMVVVSQSMIPTLGVGDLISIRRVDDFGGVVAAPQPEGDIIVYIRFSASNEFIVHRAVEKSKGEDGWQFVTKGDNNPGTDGIPVPESRVVGKVVGRAPIFGYFLLFIKTSGGLLLVASLMAIVFFADYLMPLRIEGMNAAGRFPWVFILPFLVAPVAYAYFWFYPRFDLEIGLFTVASWYVGCFTAPLAFGDDDINLMFWLYYFVLLMIPLGCDLIWRLTGITPSMWWYVKGSTVPVTWLLMEETPMYRRALTKFIQLLLPGCIIFLSTMAARRRGVRPLVKVSRWMRSSRPKSR